MAASGSTVSVDLDAVACPVVVCRDIHMIFTRCKVKIVSKPYAARSVARRSILLC